MKRSAIALISTMINLFVLCTFSRPLKAETPPPLSITQTALDIARDIEGLGVLKELVRLKIERNTVTVQIRITKTASSPLIKKVKQKWKGAKIVSEDLPGSSGKTEDIRIEMVRDGSDQGPLAKLTPPQIKKLYDLQKQDWTFNRTDLNHGTSYKFRVTKNELKRVDLIKTLIFFNTDLSDLNHDGLNIVAVYGRPDVLRYETYIAGTTTNSELTSEILKLTPSPKAGSAEKTANSAIPCKIKGKNYSQQGFSRKNDKIEMTTAFRQKILTEGFSDQLNAVHFVPNMLENKITGFRIDRLNQDSILCLSGFEIGDVVEQIKGIPMTNAGDAIRALQTLRDTPKFDVKTKRKGKIKTVVFTISESKTKK